MVAKDSVREDQILSAKVSDGRIGFKGQVGLDRSQLDQFKSVLIPAVYKSAAASPKQRPAARTTPVIIRDAAVGRSTRVMVCQRVAPRARLPDR